MHAPLMGFILTLFELAWINILLSGDNAVVIAMACRGLPNEQRHRGILMGAGAAILLRILFTFIIVQLLALPFLKLLGGLLLVWIAIKLVLDDENHSTIAGSSSIWKAVRSIAIADAVMSLDNVIAIAAAAHGDFLLILLGLAMSVPLIMFGSSLILKALDRFPILIWLGCLLLAYVACEIILAEPLVGELLPDLWRKNETVVTVVGALTVLAVAFNLDLWRARHKKGTS